MGQELGHDCRPGVFPLYDRFAEIDAFQWMTMAASRLQSGHAVVLALTAVREGDTLVVPKLDGLARFLPDALAIADQLRERGVKLALGRTLFDQYDAMAKLFFNFVAEFEADLIRM